MLYQWNVNGTGGTVLCPAFSFQSASRFFSDYMDQTNGGRRLKTFKNRTEPVQKRVAKSQKISIFNPEYL